VDEGKVDPRRRKALRIGLVLLAAGQGAAGAWALFAPKSWYDDFPGGGQSWLPDFGPYNEHFSVDVGATFLGLTAGLVFAAVMMHRRAVQAALVAYLVYAVPHAVYHGFKVDEALSAGEDAINLPTLALTVVVPIALLAMVRRPAAEAAP
jgi:hypothetical protein